jgi:hypothetical protein
MGKGKQMERDRNCDHTANYELASLSRTCYSCKTAYPERVRFCPNDGADLEYITPAIENLALDLKSRPRRLKLIIGAAAISAILITIFLGADHLLPALVKTDFTHVNSGELWIQTNPPGAKIFLDGSEIGVTPVRLSEVPSGIHILKAICPGYENGGAQIEILPSSTKKLELQLAPLTIKPSNLHLASLSFSSLFTLDSTSIRVGG